MPEAPLPAIRDLRAPALLAHPAEAELEIRRGQAILDIARRAKVEARTQVEVLRRIVELACRGADLVDEMQAAGELATTRDHKSPKFGDFGLDSRRVAEWRALRDNGALAYLDALLENERIDGIGHASLNWVLKQVHTLDVMGSSASDDWPTPQELFDLLDSEFHFELDVCASASNAKCERYFTAEDDGLTQEWRGACFMNPPYGDVIGQWMQKARESARNGATVVCLVPARVDTGWWWDHARRGEIRFLRGRLKTGRQSWPFPSAVVIFPRRARVVWWER